MTPDALPVADAELRARLGDARLLLIYTPSVCASPERALEALEAALPHVDAVQVRVKESARALYDETLRVLERVQSTGAEALVTVNDRVDVAMALTGRGVHGVHLGEDDTPPQVARQLLGTAAILGLSTHDARAVARASNEPVDYLGFGPIHPTSTKGYERGLGAEAAWIASAASPTPLFPIGGIDETNAEELGHVGRAAVCLGILCAPDPGEAARRLRELLSG